MKAKNIKWDTDGDKKLLKTLPKEMEILGNLIEVEEISEYLSDQTGYCHYGFEIEYDEKDVRAYMTANDILEAFDLSGIEITDEDISTVLKEANECGDLTSVADRYLQGVRDVLDAGLDTKEENEFSM